MIADNAELPHSYNLLIYLKFEEMGDAEVSPAVQHLLFIKQLAIESIDFSEGTEISVDPDKCRLCCCQCNSYCRGGFFGPCFGGLICLLNVTVLLPCYLWNDVSCRDKGAWDYCNLGAYKKNRSKIISVYDTSKNLKAVEYRVDYSRVMTVGDMQMEIAKMFNIPIDRQDLRVYMEGPPLDKSTLCSSIASDLILIVLPQPAADTEATNDTDGNDCNNIGESPTSKSAKTNWKGVVDATSELNNPLSESDFMKTS